MQAFENAQVLIKASDLRGPADFYQVLLTVKNGFGNGVSKLGSYSFTKADIKRAGIDWTFVPASCEVLGLKLENRHGRRGHSVSL
ncbi:MAG: hypothetical protein LW854_15045 [Rubrivivax sp.]|jgi:hypothetical protein|nr:hypothetical protein [Rubrivivax sp.]